MTRVGVVLSGCGVFDGTEIHEAVLTLLALDRAGAQRACFAPNVDFEVIDHTTGKPTGERRNVLVESARIARGEIEDIAEARADELDALVFPGGFGAVKNLCDFAATGEGARVHPEVARLVADMLELRRPMAFVCIAPAIAALCLREANRSGRLTIGDDADTARRIEALAGEHVECQVDEFCIDEASRIVSTPAYMLAKNVAEAATGIERAVAVLLEMAGRPAA